PRGSPCRLAAGGGGGGVRLPQRGARLRRHVGVGDRGRTREPGAARRRRGVPWRGGGDPGSRLARGRRRLRRRGPRRAGDPRCHGGTPAGWAPVPRAQALSRLDRRGGAMRRSLLAVAGAIGGGIAAGAAYERWRSNAGDRLDVYFDDGSFVTYVEGSAES